MWFLVNSRSDKGARRALTALRRARDVKLLSHDCGQSGTREGENTIWGPCTVRWSGEGGDTVSTRLFGQIIERDQQYKVLSYSNGPLARRQHSPRGERRDGLPRQHVARVVHRETDPGEPHDHRQQQAGVPTRPGSRHRTPARPTWPAVA